MIRLAALLLAAASLAACSGWDAQKHPATSGLRWLGDATVAGARDGTALGGPAVRFRAGGELSAAKSARTRATSWKTAWATG